MAEENNFHFHCILAVLVARRKEKSFAARTGCFLANFIRCDLIGHVISSEVLRYGQYLLCWIDICADL